MNRYLIGFGAVFAVVGVSVAVADFTMKARRSPKPGQCEPCQRKASDFSDSDIVSDHGKQRHLWLADLSPTRPPTATDVESLLLLADSDDHGGTKRSRLPRRLSTRPSVADRC